MRRRPRPRRAPGSVEALSVTIRQADERDQSALRALAWTNARALPDGPWMVAEVNGNIRAAVQIRGVATLADPRTEQQDLISLLRTRVQQVSSVELDRQLASMADLEITDADWRRLLGDGS